MSESLDIEIIETGALEREVRIGVDAARVDTQAREALEHLRGRVKVKGFRPGKVPRRELERRYGKSVRRDVVKGLIQTTLAEALRRDELLTVLYVSPPEVVEDTGAGGFRFRFQAEVKPTHEPTGYLGVGLTQPASEVSQGEIDAHIEELREQHAIVEPVEDRDEVRDDDWVTISYQAVGADGEAIDASETLIDLSDENLTQGMAQGLVGMRVGETRAVPLRFAAGSTSAERMGTEEAEVMVTIEGIKKRTLPEVDDDLADLVAQVESVGELREWARQQLAQRREQETRRALRRQLEEHLLDGADFDLPAAFVGSRVDEQVQSQLRMLGMDPQRADTSMLARLREAAQDEVGRRVRLEFVLDAIAERENVKVSDAELNRAVDDVVRGAGAHGAELRRIYAQPSRRAGLKERLRLDKTLDFLLSKATISEGGPSNEDSAPSAGSPDPVEREAPEGTEGGSEAPVPDAGAD